MIERLRVRIPAEAAGKKILHQSSHCVLTLTCSVSVPLPCYDSLHVEDPDHSAKKCKWQVTPKHAYTLDPTKSEWADYAAVQAQCGNLSGNELTCNSSGKTRPQSSQLAEPLWTDPGQRGGISMHDVISTKSK